MLHCRFLKVFRFLHRSSPVILALSLLFISSGLFSQTNSVKKWVGTWSTAPQLVEPGNMPPSPGLTDNSLRQIVRVSIGGDTLRVKFSNEFSSSPVLLKSVQIAVSTGGSTIDVSTSKELKFNGGSEITMNAGFTVTSDPIAFNLTPRMDVAITINYGETSETTTGHPGSRTTSYLLAGNTTATSDFTDAVTTDHWYNMNTIDVYTESNTACVAILGNSITDGRGSTTNMQNRWPDVFSESLLNNSGTQHIGVLNLGIGGNSLLSGGLGPTGLSRYDRDILDQAGVRWAFIFIGVNDIGGVRSADAATSTANNLIAAYKQMIVKAHARNIRIYCGTILPFNGSGYYSQYSDLCRIAVNQWILTSGWFDKVIDFDKAMRNPQDTSRLLLPAYQNDGLHPDAEGYKVMGEYIDLNLFTGSDTIYTQDPNQLTESIWFEAERFVTATAGSDFNIVDDGLASNGKYITVKAGTQSLSAAPTSSKALITIPFTVSRDTTYNIFGRMKNPTADDDSFWVKIDNSAFTMCNGLATGDAYGWLKLVSSDLSEGNHTLTIGYREDGACLDKICITNDEYAPSGKGGDDLKVGINTLKSMDGYFLGQNFPNPFHEKTNISFEIPKETFVSLKVYDLHGSEIAELAGSVFSKGKHNMEFKSKDLKNGVYFYSLGTEKYYTSRKMVSQD